MPIKVFVLYTTIFFLLALLWLSTDFTAMPWAGFDSTRAYDVALLVLSSAAAIFWISRKFFNFLDDGAGARREAELLAQQDKLAILLEDLKLKSVPYEAALEQILNAEKVDNSDPEQIEEIKQRAANVIVEREFVDRVDQEVARRRAADGRTDYQNSVADIVSRLSAEVRELGKRATLNLYIGSLISVFGLVGLAYFISLSKADLADNLDLRRIVLEFVMRLSLVVILQVFAYFFLRLYRQSIYDIKLFQNELTNVQSKNVAVYVALLADDQKALSAIGLALSKTERNFILKKDERTVALLDDEREGRYESAVIGTAERLVEKLAAVRKQSH